MIGTYVIIAGIILFLITTILSMIEGDAGIFMGGVVIAIMVLSVGAFFLDQEYSPIASEQAQKYCELKGYDRYDTFNRKPFGDKAYGIRCNLIKNRKEKVEEE